ncbi:MAG TPA: cytochrome P450 [Solirubrobacterales bacterium]|nr:cytochrome P450 [Solirubrobacterales bacterium]
MWVGSSATRSSGALAPRRQSHDRGRPHGSAARPADAVCAQTAIWFGNAQWMLRQCAARFGDTFRLRILNEGTWVVLSHPDHVKQVFTGDPRVYHAGEGNQILLPVLGEHSVLLLDESTHLEQRKLLLPPFHGKRMERYGELMAQIAGAEIESWPRDEPYRLRPRMQALTLEIILRAVFGLAEGERLLRLRAELRRLLDMVTNPRMMIFPALLGPQRLVRMKLFQRDIARMDGPIYEEIAERRRASDLAERDDILSLLLQARHEDGSPMSDVELRDELLTLLVAGHETTATALAWAVERLIRHPEKLDRLTEETRAGETEYLDAVVTETLRLRPVISVVARRLTEPVEIGGWELPAGVTVTPSIYLVHRRPDVYPEPERFLPERFIDNPPGTYTWIPFGGGVRRCLGGAFAQFEMRVVLAELVRRLRLEPVRAEPEPVKRRAITETPRHNTEVIIK